MKWNINGGQVRVANRVPEFRFVPIGTGIPAEQTGIHFDSKFRNNNYNYYDSGVSWHQICVLIVVNYYKGADDNWLGQTVN